MRELKEIAERLGYAQAKYEQTNTGYQPEITQRWAHEMSLLGWVLGDEWTSYGVMAPKRGE